LGEYIAQIKVEVTGSEASGQVSEKEGSRNGDLNIDHQNLSAGSQNILLSDQFAY
jgi:hypothetical protein